MARWSETVLALAAVAKLRALLGLPSGDVLLAPAGDVGQVMVPHVSDVWGLPIVDSCPGHDQIAELGPRLAVADDAADIVVVDWLTDQRGRSGSTVMQLRDGRKVRLAPAEDGGAFFGSGLIYADWIRQPGAPRGFAALAPQARVDTLAERATAIEEEFYDYLGLLGDQTDRGWCDYAAFVFEDALESLLDGRVRVRGPGR